jgi:outer membrane protein assembly factor BamB
VAREKVSDADADKVTDADGTDETDESAPDEKSDSAEKSASSKEAGSPKKAGSAKKSSAKNQKSTAKTPGKKAGPAKKSAAAKSAAAKESATAKRAAEARAVMQRHHRRLAFARAAAVGVEVVGAAGLVAASLLPWEWTDRLWGRTDDNAWVAVQVALAAVVLALAVAWLWRSNDRVCTWARTIAVLASLVVAGIATALVWQADLGARAAGGIVAVAAAVLVIAGSTGWLLGLRRLRTLFAFGVGYARNRGYGNLRSVRRAQLVGLPIGAVGAAAIVAGTFLVAPGLVSTEQASTASPLDLTGAPPTGGGEPSWEMELAVADGQFATAHATPGGLLVDELHGIRGVDPRDGTVRWFWRDEAYRRAAVVVVDGGQTVVLALEYEGEQAGRDLLVALDTATGELRWDRFDDEAVASLANNGVAAEGGDWAAGPDSVLAPDPEATDPNAVPQLGVRLVGTGDGQTLWRYAGTEGCQNASIVPGSPDVVLLVENCAVPELGLERCQVSGLDAADGAQLWTWPTDERVDPEVAVATQCRATALEDQVFLNYTVTATDPESDATLPAEPPALSLDPATGAELWAAERDEDSYATAGVDGLNSPAAVVGDQVLGIEWPSGQPGQGPAVLIMRDVGDGSRVGEVELPEGQPVGIKAVDDDTLMLSYYRPQSPDAQILLVEVDLAAGEVTGESVVTTGPESDFRSAGLTVGPETVVVDTIMVPGESASPDDIRLVVRGFS